MLSLDCESCVTSYHPSCAQQAGVLNKNNKLICCVPRENSEVKSDLNKNKKALCKNMDETKMRNIIKEVFAESFASFKKIIESEMKELRTSVQYMSDAFDDNKLATEEVVNEIRRLRQENVCLQKKVQLLENKINYQEQKEKQNNLIIVGVPKQPDDIKKTVSKITVALQVTKAEENITETFRIGKKEDGPIMVKFKNHEIKYEIIKNIRKTKGLKVSECGLLGKNNNIYLNEDLTQNNQMLYKKAREVKKQKKFKSVYCSHGKIYVRKNDQDPPFRIYSEDDLEN